MTHLQKLLGEKLAEGKSYRRMEEECGVNHNSLSDYHQKGKTPHHGKNLAVLAKYLKVPIEMLLEPVDAPSVPAPRPSPEDQLLYEVWCQLSRDQKLDAIKMLRTLTADD